MPQYYNIITGKLIPSEFSIFGEVLAINGSSTTGKCLDAFGSANIIVCEAVESSVLFDGLIPILDFSRNIWSEDLLTLSSSAELLIRWPDGTLLSRLEATVFNCPEWGIAVQGISISIPGEVGIIASTIATNTSCDDLINVSLALPIMHYPVIRLHFDIFPSSQSLSIAEVRFYSDACLQRVKSTPETLSKTIINYNSSI